MGRNQAMRLLLVGKEAKLIDSRIGAHSLWFPKRDETAKRTKRARKVLNVLSMEGRKQ